MTDRSQPIYAIVSIPLLWNLIRTNDFVASERGFISGSRLGSVLPRLWRRQSKRFTDQELLGRRRGGGDMASATSSLRWHSASLIDCHSLNLAIARAYRDEQRPIGSTPRIGYVTANLNVSYIKPTPLGETLELRARIDKLDGRK